MTHHNPVAAHPGDHLRAHLETSGMSLSDLARATKLSKAYLSDVLMRKRSVGVKTAMRLERVFGFGADMWLGIQADWDLHEARKRSEI